MELAESRLHGLCGQLSTGLRAGLDYEAFVPLLLDRGIFANPARCSLGPGRITRVPMCRVAGLPWSLILRLHTRASGLCPFPNLNTI